MVAAVQLILTISDPWDHPLHVHILLGFLPLIYVGQAGLMMSS